MGRDRAATTLVVVAAVAASMSHGAPAWAAWPAATARAATLSMAVLGTAVTKVSGDGALTPAATGYTVSGLVTERVGYVKLTNTSTTPALLSLSYRMQALGAGTTIQQCPRPWAADGTCTGAATLADSQLLASLTGSHTWPTPFAPGDEVHLKVRAAGAASGVSFTTTAVAARGPANRTTS